MKRCFPLALAILLFWAVPVIWSQGGGGGLTGLVVDSSGAIIPNADVEITSNSTGVLQRTATTSAGQFVYPVLPVGSYTLTVTAAGFQKAVLKAITIDLNQTANVDVTLQPGSVQQSIEVNAAVAQIQPETAQQATTISNHEYTALPLAVNGEARSPVAFLFLAPGVNAPTQQNSTNLTFSTSINGGQSFSSEVLIDGASIQSSNVAGDYRNLQFPVDVVNEFTLVASNFTADYGRASGGIVTLNTKSGTNDLHGSAFEYLRNDVMDARGFFQPTTPIERQNEFGFTLGGPVYIPKVYNGRNKTFFFGYYSGFRYRAGASNSTGTLPTEAQRGGDFSAYPYPIYDPASTVPDGQGGYTRTRFAGNIIPASRIISIAQKFNALLPATNGQLVNNVISAQGQRNDIDRWGVKVDQYFGSNHHLSGLAMISQGSGSSPQFGDVYTGNLSQTIVATQNVYYGRFNYTWTISPTVLNQFTAGFNRNYGPYGPIGAGSNLAAQLGIQGVPSQVGPAFAFNSGYTNAGNSDGQIVAENSWVWNDFVSWTKGAHTMKFGFDYRRNGDNTTPLSGSNFVFAPNETGQPNSPNFAATGNGYASFLLGAVDNASLTLNVSSSGNRYQYLAAYVMDDWKVSKSLTLNLGVRYDIPWTRREVANRMSSFDPSIPNPAAGGRLGAYKFAGYGTGLCNCIRFADVDYSLVQPRFGFAYKWGDKTVIRGGYSIFAGMSGDVVDNGIRQGYNNGFNTNASIQSLDNGVTPAFYIQNGYPQNFKLPPFIDPGLNLGQSAAWLAKEDGRTALIQNWSLQVQRQIPWRTLLQVGYIANKGNRLSSGLLNVNQVDPRYLSLGSLLNQPFNSSAAIAAGITSPYPGFIGSVAQALRPYPQYTSISRYNNTAGNSTYNSLQVQLQHQFSAGLSLMVSYTWSKWLTDAEAGEGWYDSGPLNNYNRKLEKSLSQTDIPQNVTISYVYELPVGKGKPVNTTGVLNAFVGGWQISGTHRYQSGYPLGIGVNNTLPIFSGQRPICFAGANPYASYQGRFDPGKDVYLNAAAFGTPAPFTFGDCSRTLPNLRGFPFFNEDFALSKHFRYWERLDPELRFEVFNAFNRVIFSNPATNISNTGFGTVGGQANQPRLAQVGLHLKF
ncbi:MAG: TonB-dependent receptor [Acidobacteriaceae bacterium]|nr:TonB-dependent receptor [Acidobacteriaceae bacterium]MBV9304565.1 TonB-dependent receptor [Acidobacteriaceae bacterium]